MKNKVEEGGALGSRIKNEQEGTKTRARKMMRRRVAPFVVLTLV